MSQETEESPQARPQLAIIMLLIVLFILIIIVGWLLWPGRSRPLKPFHPTATPGAVEFDGQPTLVSFTDLQNAPSNYVNQRIRVTGDFTSIAPPDCIQFSGPIAEWGLISDELQMNAIGMESIMQLVPDGTGMTIQGIWQRYIGPVGCGKEPETSTVWYLAVEHVLEPNPLPTFGTPIFITPPPNNNTATPMGTAVPIESGTPFSPTPTDAETSTPTAASVINTPTATATNGVIQLTTTATPTISGIATTAATATTSGETAVPTATLSPDSTATTTPTPTPTSTDGGQATPTSGPQPPPAATATPDDNPYPVETNTPAPPSYP